MEADHDERFLLSHVAIFSSNESVCAGVAADLDDEGSLEQAFAGASAAFCVTNYWEHFSPERELAQAGSVAKAARAAGLEHVIWSTLEDTRKWIPLNEAGRARREQSPNVSQTARYFRPLRRQP